MERSTEVSGKETAATAMVSRPGLMEQGMLETGALIKLMVKAYFGMSLATNTKASGRTTRRTVTASIHILTEQSTKDIGKKTCNTAGASKNGPTVPSTRATMKRAANTDTALTRGRMALDT